MKQFFASFLGSLIGILVAMVLFVIIILASIASMVSSGSDKPFYTKKNSILHIKLDHAITERGIKNPLGDLGLLGSGSSLGLDQVLECFENAKADSSIKGIFLNVADVAAPAATMEEIRNAMIDFKTTGKFIISYSEIYSQKAYYLASVADKIYVNPEGSVELKGLSAQVMFYKNALEKLEIDAQIFRHGKFKSAIEPFDLTQMSEANRLQTMTYVSSLWNHMLQGISKTRKISIDELNRLADDIKIETAKDAETYKLVDGLKYEDEIIAMMMEKTGVTDVKKLNYVELKDYVRAPRKEKENESESKIAVIYANGSIESGEGDDETIGSERIAKAIREARLDSTVKAIVLRVNSPGGSALASDVMWRETVLAKKVKPFIVSMGDYAASGGYYIACAADVIVAQPNTITGSIGVFGVLPNAQAFLNNKLGITFDTVNTNKHSDMGALYRPVKPQEAAAVQRMVEQVYTSFISKVAEGRKMTTAQVDSIGQGRVWSGADAQKIGLVDELGGLELAIRIAAERAKIEEYKLVPMPKTKDGLEGLFGGMGAQMKEDMVKEQLGMHYLHFKHMKNMMNVKGIQARLPYDVVLY